MASSQPRRSPLHDVADRLTEAGELPERIRLTETPFLTQLALRVAPSTPCAEAVASVLGVPLPTAPNTTSTDGEVNVLWMGPDEWLVIAPDSTGERLREELEARLVAHQATVVDVSAQRTIIEVAGADAREMLSKGCPLDLHPRVFAPGCCAQTSLARTQVVLLARSEEPAYWVLVRASFAEYLADWLLDAAAEYRGAPPLDLSLAGEERFLGVPA